MMEQFSAATAHVVLHLEAHAQRLLLCRRAFCEGLAEAAALNDAQTQTGLYRMDVGGAPFHTGTEVLHRYGGTLLQHFEILSAIFTGTDEQPPLLPR